MPGRADYWKYLIVQEMLAVCQIAGCTKPNVLLGPLPKAVEKKIMIIMIMHGLKPMIEVQFFFKCTVWFLMPSRELPTGCSFNALSPQKNLSDRLNKR